MTEQINATEASAYTATERYTANEIARKEKLHPSTIRKLFAGEPGVLKVGRVLRIPGHVATRVFDRCTVA